MNAPRHCTVVCDAPDRPVVLELTLPDGPISIGGVLELARAHAAMREVELAWDEVPAGLWGRQCARSTPVRNGDRVEVYRPLPLDPRLARRARAAAARRASGTVK
jgi:putative ubiquitin-RnfH superfamily antitoxin RatB of RatAB toxin-antitoxin module